MNLQELEAKYAELKELINYGRRQIDKDLEDITKEIEKLKAEPKVWPQVGDRYWYITSDGEVKFAFNNSDWDKLLFAIGNCFRTREEAEAELDARKVVAELRRCEGAVPYSKNGCVSTIYANLSNGIVQVATDTFGDSALHCFFEYREHASAAIAKVGKERIISAARWLAMREVG